MNRISITNTVGYAKIVAILAFALVVFSKYMTLIEATAVITVVLGLLSAVGNFYAQDINAPRTIQKTELVERKGDQPAMVVTTVEAPEDNP